MDIRTFRAATLQEALEQVRETLGPDAAVLHTRQVKRSRMGLFSSRLIEVEASVEMPVVSRFNKRSAATASPLIANQATTPSKSEKSEADPHNPTTLASPARDLPEPSLVRGGAQAATIHQDTMQKSAQSEAHGEAVLARTSHSNSEAAQGHASRLPPAMYEVLSEMLDAGVAPADAKALLQTAAEQLAPEQLNDAWLLQGRICQLVSKNLRVAEPIAVHQGHQSVVALVGPTGVGKTTTLAKLATSFQLDHRCQVGLITMDTLRPGAVDQLLQYAESLNAALEVVSSANQFLPALQRLKNCDVLFIDTAGRSPNDSQQIGVLQGLLQAAQPTSVQLVVSATSSMGHVQAALEQFAPLNPTGLVITKLDEAVGFGAWLATLQNCDLPVSYLTHGQHVPRDFSSASRRRLASLLLGHANQPVA